MNNTSYKAPHNALLHSVYTRVSRALTISSACILVALPLAFTSCGDDEDDTAPARQTEFPDTIHQEPIDSGINVNTDWEGDTVVKF